MHAYLAGSKLQPSMGKAMNAGELIDQASFGPDALKVINQAFDDAWSERAADFNPGAQAEAAPHSACGGVAVSGERGRQRVWIAQASSVATDGFQKVVGSDFNLAHYLC
jgi:hypothetical protein